MEHLPVYISVVFILTTFLTVWLFYKATGYSKPAITTLLLWMALQAAVSISGFYTITSTVPPRLALLLAPPFILIAGLFITARGRRFIDSLDIKTLTLLHMVRIPVEVVLLWLFLHKAVPHVMTFEGRNFDIISGLSAPLIYYLVFIRNRYNRTLLLLWNIVCLALLVNIVIIALLSAPFSFQKLGFDQPNIAILYFPFVWLPGCIVPIVLFSHLTAIRYALRTKEEWVKGRVLPG